MTGSVYLLLLQPGTGEDPTAPYVHHEGPLDGVVAYAGDGVVAAPSAGGIIVPNVPPVVISPAVTVVNEIQNPSIEVNLSGTGGNGGGVTSRSSEEALFGSWSLKVVCPGAGTAEGGTFFTGLPSNGTDVLTTQGDQWMLSCFVKGPPGAQIRLAARYALGATFITETTGTNNILDGTWTRISYLATTPSGVDRLRIKVYTTTAQAITFYVDGAMLTSGPTLHPFTMPGLAGYATWNATAHYSPSTIKFPAGYRHFGSEGGGVVLDTRAAGTVSDSKAAGVPSDAKGAGTVSSPVLGGA